MRSDFNQKEIVAALRKMGASVQVLSSVGKGCPDILVGFAGKNYLFEIKDGKKPPSQRKLTLHEEAFFKKWKGSVFILNSVDEILNFLGK